MVAVRVLVFGEDDNDRTAIRHLIPALLPINTRTEIKAIRRPIVLSRGADRRKKKAMAQEIAGFYEVFARRGRVTVVVHRDCDALEPSHIENTANLLGYLGRAGVTRAVPATPAWEIESWWMHFPEAIRQTRPCWRNVNYAVAGIGMIANAKERLARDLRPRGRGRNCPDFSESDGIRIAQIIAEHRLADDLRRLGGGSLRDFRDRLIATI